MTLAQLTADHIFAELNSTGFSSYTITSINKHPLQNAFLGEVAIRLNVAGLQSTFRSNVNQSMSDRGIVLIYDGLPTLQRNGVWDKIFLSQDVRYIVSVGHSYEDDDFEGDYELQSETELTDTDGVVTIQTWKRIKVRI